MTPKEKLDSLISEISYCDGLFELELISKKIGKDKLAGKLWTKTSDYLKIIRVIYKERLLQLQRRANCRPHNDPSRWKERDEKIYCTVCGDYVGRKWHGKQRATAAQLRRARE